MTNTLHRYFPGEPGNSRERIQDLLLFTKPTEMDKQEKAASPAESHEFCLRRGCISFAEAIRFQLTDSRQIGICRENSFKSSLSWRAE